MKTPATTPRSFYPNTPTKINLLRCRLLKHIESSFFLQGTIPEGFGSFQVDNHESDQPKSPHECGIDFLKEIKGFEYLVFRTFTSTVEKYGPNAKLICIQAIAMGGSSNVLVHKNKHLSVSLVIEWSTENEKWKRQPQPTGVESIRDLVKEVTKHCLDGTGEKSDTPFDRNIVGKVRVYNDL
jgi:hypothetical protein